MPELRKDPIVGRWIIISTERRKRPSDWPAASRAESRGFCPFCPGNEDKTPPEISALRDDGSAPNSPGWKVRVIPNKFPALQIEGELERRGEGLYDWMSGIGAHEVIIESPHHSKEFASLDAENIAGILRMYRARMLDLRNDLRFKYVLVFKNHGRSAGASLEHSHSQLIAMPILPKRVMEELDGAKKHFDLKERCVFCDIISQEIAAEKRVIAQSKAYITIAPFAPRFPFEMWLLPRAHTSHYEMMPDENYAELAIVLREVLQRMNRALQGPHYNFVIHSTPIQNQAMPEYHWHIEIIPKLSRIAGFEWGSGFYINPVPPEEAAKILRQAGV